MFDKFINRYIIKGELISVTALHIGAAEDVFSPGGCKNPFLRNAAGLPIIPGSSLKGAMRNFLEVYLSSSSGQKRLSEETGYNQGICNRQNPCADIKNDNKLKDLLKNKKADADKKLSDYLYGPRSEGGLCIICRIFGSQCSAAKLSIRDAGVPDNIFQDGFEIRSGVSIDRNLGTNVDGNKFETEVVPEGTHFSFCAVLENADSTEWNVVKKLLKALESGMIPIGGMKSRGLGEIKLINTVYQYIDGENIADYLAEKDIGFIGLKD